MANVLKMAKIQSIQQLHASGWSQRRIARRWRSTGGRLRGTYNRRRRTQNQPLRPPAPTGKCGPFRPCRLRRRSGRMERRHRLRGGAKCRHSARRVAGGQHRAADRNASFPRGRPSRCEPLRELILAKLDQQLSAQRIWQDLREDPGFTGGYDSVKRFVAVLAPRRHEFLLRADSRPIQLSANRRRRRSRRLTTADSTPATPARSKSMPTATSTFTAFRKPSAG